MTGSDSIFSRSARTRFVLTALLALLLLGVLAAAAEAVPLSGSANPLPGSRFEGGDGNQVVDNPLNVDWATAVGVRHFPDPQLNDQIFKGGSKENEPALWDFVNQTGGSTPGKNNILDAYALVEESATTGDTFLHLAFTREDATGTTFMAFELNQRTDLWDNGVSDTLIPCRTTGDIIVTLQVEGNDPSVILQEWTTTATDPATGCATAGSLTDFTAFVDNVDAQGAVNDAPIPNLLPSSFDWPGDVIPTNLFVEASLNLTTLLESLNDSPCFSFGSIWMHTRASTSDESNLDDYIAPQPLFVGNCTASGVKYNDLNGDGDRDAGEPGLGGFRIWADYDNDGELDPGEPFDDTDPVTGAYSISGIQDPSGTYSLREMLTPPATGTGGWICSQPATPGTNGVFPCAYLNIDGEATPNVTGKDFGNFKPGEIELDKVADDATVSAGDPIGFTLTVSNTGEGLAHDVTLTDTLPSNAGLSWSESPDSPDCSITAGVLSCDFGDLAPDATRSVHISSPTTAESCGAVNNTASVTTSNDGTDEDSDSTFVDCPAIVVEKDGPATVYHGDQVTFTFKVTNPGNVGLTDVVVSDDTCSPVTGPTAKTGGNQDAVLEPGELWTYTCTMSVPAHQAGEDNPIVNTVTATGTDRNGGHPSDTDSHSTRILHPAIDIEKTGPATATAGSVLSYTLTVKNTGDSPFVSVVVTDPGCDDMPTLTSKNGDPTPATLDPGVDAWTYVCSHATTAGQSSFTNVANVTGRDRNNRPATDTDSFPTVLNQVLPEPPVVRGTARLRGPSGCVRGPFRATVRGSRIARVTFFVDGKRFRRITAPNGEGSRFSVRINPRGRGFGVHRVTARVQFAAGAQTKTRTLRLSFQRCKRQVVRPRFGAGAPACPSRDFSAHRFADLRSFDGRSIAASNTRPDTRQALKRTDSR